MKNNYLYSRRLSWELAERIENFWHRKGYRHVRVWVESVYNNETEPYQVRSNIKFADA